jgi:hypothetical protein
VELHQLHPFVGAVLCELGRQVLGEVRLPGSGRAVQHQLPVFLQQVGDFLQRLQIHVEGIREVACQRTEPALGGRHDGGRFRTAVGLCFRLRRDERLQRLHHACDVDDDPGRSELALHVARQFGHAVGFVEPAHLPAHPAVVGVVVGFPEDDADADSPRVLVQGQVPGLHDGQERENRRLGVLPLHVAEVLVVLVHGVLDQPCRDARIQQAEMLDVERHLFLGLPGGEKLGVVVVGAQQPGAPARISHLAPLAHELTGVPVDALAGLFVEVQADAADIGSDFFVAVALGAAHEGGEGVTDLPAFDVGHDRLEEVGPGKELDAAPDCGLVVRGAGCERVEGQRILQRLGDGCGGLLVHVADEPAEPHEVVPDGPVEFSRPVPDNAVVGHALVQLVRELKGRLQPGRRLGHAGTLDLQRLHLVGQRQRLQEQQFNGELLGGA